MEAQNPTHGDVVLQYQLTQMQRNYPGFCDLLGEDVHIIHTSTSGVDFDVTGKEKVCEIYKKYVFDQVTGVDMQSYGTEKLDARRYISKIQATVTRTKDVVNITDVTTLTISESGKIQEIETKATVTKA